MHADVFVAVAGTALHNVLFMPPPHIRPTAQVVLMQPGWCDHRRLYTDQAFLLGIPAYTLCHGREALHDHLHPNSHSDVHGVNVRLYQFSRQFWRQGPRLYKDVDFEVDVDIFVSTVLKAVHTIAPGDVDVDAGRGGSGIPGDDLSCVQQQQQQQQQEQQTDVDPAEPTQPNLSNSASNLPLPKTIVETYLSSITSVPLYHDNDNDNTNNITNNTGGKVESIKGWQLALRGQFGLPLNRRLYRNAMETLSLLPDLGVCLSLSPGNTTTINSASFTDGFEGLSDTEEVEELGWCTPLSQMNYFSSLILKVPVESPLQVIPVKSSRIKFAKSGV